MQYILKYKKTLQHLFLMYTTPIMCKEYGKHAKHKENYSYTIMIGITFICGKNFAIKG